MKFQPGAVVVPIAKSIGVPFEQSIMWKKAKEIKQPYLFFTGHIAVSDKGIALLCDVFENGSFLSGDYFREEDLIPFEEVQNRVEKSKPDYEKAYKMLMGMLNGFGTINCEKCPLGDGDCAFPCDEQIDAHIKKECNIVKEK